ncbi:hypothetical protein [Ectothiorhodospira shaposhnikovii]|uniref:hypothetical protein n=1 Tax=Ectothiorhodospira shaposhnikovii TaxID=1054 RepID=UPI0039A379F1
MVFPTASVLFRYPVAIPRLAMLSMLLFCAGTVQAQPVLSILPESTGCMAVLTSQAGGLYRGCGPHWRFRRVAGAPEALPVALTESHRSLILGTRTGLYQRPSDQTGWQQLSDQPTGALACHGAHCVVRFFGQGPRRLSDGRLSPPQVRGLPDQPLQQFVIAGDGALYGAGMGAGVLWLKPGSDTWQPVGSGLGNGNVLTLARADDGTLHAGTYGGGLYRLRPGETRWRDDAIRHPLYVEAVALIDGTELALTEDNRLVRLRRREDGTWVERNAYQPPGPPPYALTATGDRVYLGTVDGLHELDPVHGTWRDITPTY